MSVLVFGSNGQVGRAVVRALDGRMPVLAATRSGRSGDGRACLQADFDRPAEIRALLDAERPSQVVNAAAYTAVDRAEGERDAAFRVNAHTPALIAQWCASHDVPLVHYSTDYVFDGRGHRPYRVDDPVAPLSVYGESKLAGERAIQEAGGRHLIFRTAWVYAAYGNNFLRTMLKLAAERDELRVVADQIGTPTPAALIAAVTARALDGVAASGIWHLTAAGQTTWHGFAEQLLARAVERGLLARMPRVQAIASVDFPTVARRPAYSCLDPGELARTFGVRLPDWREGLAEVMDALPPAQR
ncbi:dTDP-4-dehydrorhamnose reductase [Xanthomonas sp. AM6]|uniref:dTDP-4-dehydrorhamnose reductase n=1 Tax=Xanthomonas sp. AM6 TaxID=2982531 RepID=UPI0021D9A090|nr:dTDP-4-dehydrorhamnose reductase [Xanthomonas sp. AM6]UYB51721.1 dTDP-4-dehydrorhamnose reductase [Xanthomonas sp. AM6]